LESSLCIYIVNSYTESSYSNYLALIPVKRTILYIFFALFLFNTGSANAITYRDNFSIEVRTQKNSEENINKAKLLEKYAVNYKKEVGDLQIMYEIPSSILLKENTKKVSVMIDALKRIQTKFIEKKDAEEILSSVIQGLKEVNTQLTPYLKKNQTLYKERIQKIRGNYNKIGTKISRALKKFIDRISLKLSKKDKLTKRDKEVIKVLVRLQENIKKIERFKEIKLWTKRDMKDYYINIIRSIRSEIRNLKSVLK